MALYRQGHVLGTYEIPTDVTARRPNLEAVVLDVLRRGEGWDLKAITLSLDGWSVYVRRGCTETWDEATIGRLVPGDVWKAGSL